MGKEYTNPIEPETSTKEKPVKAHRTKGLTGDGLRQIEIIKKAKRIPTPIATPVRHIKGILEAKYLNPKSTRMQHKSWNVNRSVIRLYL